MANLPALQREGAEAPPAAQGQPAATRQWRQVETEDEAAELARKAQEAHKPLTPEEAQALRALQPPMSPWRVVGVQAGVGVVVALLLALSPGPMVWTWSFLYGAAAVVVPGALMAWGITRPVSRSSAGAGVASFFVWEAVKVGTAVALLLLAPVFVQPLSWPALLAGLVLCLKCYWVALLWRGSKKN